MPSKSEEKKDNSNFLERVKNLYGSKISSIVKNRLEKEGADKDRLVVLAEVIREEDKVHVSDDGIFDS